MKTLGIDYGLKRVGVAVSDDTGQLAFPRTVLSERGEALVSAIQEIARAEGARQVVLGYSVDFGGRENDLMFHVYRLRDDLERRELEVILEPETFSSVEAARFQGEHAMLDASAAAIILQRYLDKQVPRS